MLERDTPLPHPHYPTGHLNYRTLNRNQQIYLATLKGLTDLVFMSPPPPVPLISLPVPATSLSQATLPTISSLPGYPETSYLDNARILLLSTDAADATVLCMLLLLYRQLAFCESAPTKVDDTKLKKLKNEIRDIGTSRLGYCYYCKCIPDAGSDGTLGGKVAARDYEKWRGWKQDVVLQIAMRATEARQHPSAASTSSVGTLPDESTLSLAQRWTDSNILHDSPLNVLLRARLRDTVFNAVVNQSYPPRDISLLENPKPLDSAEITLSPGSGMEHLAEEIRLLAEKISRLALIHLNAYLPLYESDDFLELSPL